MRNSTMEYKVNQAYEELKRLIQWNPDSEEKFLQKMVCLLLPGQRKCWSEAIRAVSYTHLTLPTTPYV